MQNVCAVRENEQTAVAFSAGAALTKNMHRLTGKPEAFRIKAH